MFLFQEKRCCTTQPLLLWAGILTEALPISYPIPLLLIRN